MSTVSRLANMSIRSKIICAFSALMVIIVALGITAVQRLSVLNGTVETITSDTLVGTGYLSEMRGAILHYRLALTKAILGKADVKGDALDRYACRVVDGGSGTGSQVCANRRNG